MAVSGFLASTVGLLVLISLTNGQIDSTCTESDTRIGSLKGHAVYPQLFYQCTAKPEEFICAEGTVFDTNAGGCNHVQDAKNPAAPCSAGLVGTQYPGVCCQDFYRCSANFQLVKLECPTGQVFNNQSRQCGSGSCINHIKCQRNQPPSGNPRPCNMVADPSSPCNFRINNNGTMSEVQSCAEGSRVDVSVCTCIRDPSVPCMRSANSSGSMTQDPQCRASFYLQFNRFNSNNVPLAVSEKTGNTLPDFIDGTGVQYADSQALLNPGDETQTGAQSSLYIASYAGKQMTNNVIIEVIFRATRAGNFGIISNNRDGACAATFSFNATYNGNGAYQVNGLVTGVSALGTNQQSTNSVTVSLTINVGSNDFVLLRVIFVGRVTVQLINRGPNGNNNGQVVNFPESGVIGQNLFYNRCGFQIGRLLPGYIKSFLVREGCANTELFRT